MNDQIINSATKALWKMFPEATSVGVTHETMSFPGGRETIEWSVWVGVRGGPNILESDAQLLVAVQRAMTQGAGDELRVVKAAMRELLPASAFASVGGGR